MGSEHVAGRTRTCIIPHEHYSYIKKKKKKTVVVFSTGSLCICSQRFTRGKPYPVLCFVQSGSCDPIWKQTFPEDTSRDTRISPKGEFPSSQSRFFPSINTSVLIYTERHISQMFSKGLAEAFYFEVHRNKIQL